MARHPEVSDESIINAGIAIEKLGKVPNPGAIRAKLGYRGGLLRIKSIWNEYLLTREGELVSSSGKDLTLESLPEEYASNAQILLEKLQRAMEQIFVEGYVKSRDLFDARLTTLERAHQEKMSAFSESEMNADQCIAQMEMEVNEYMSECNNLAKQNADLLLVNSELRGRLAVFETVSKKSVLPSQEES